VATIWLTYAWDDNRQGDVDYIIQELTNYGVAVNFDRRNIRAGLRLWDQIEDFIQNGEHCDAWVLYATQNSLVSEACREEFTYALDRALHSRGDTFPLIGLFPESVDVALIPAAIRTRLYVNLTEPNWKERIKAAAEGRTPDIGQQPMHPYYLYIHPNGNERCIIEVRPRAGTWSPFVAGVPIAESDFIEEISCGPSGQIPMGDMMFGEFRDISGDGEWALLGYQNQATPIQSYYIFCRRKPSRLLFGSRNGDSYIVDV
jgi:hypothetical protein